MNADRIVSVLSVLLLVVVGVITQSEVSRLTDRNEYLEYYAQDTRKKAEIVYSFTDNVSLFNKIIVDEALAHAYIINEYDCTEFSYAVEARLIAEGWNAYTYPVMNGTHRIVKVSEVYIEAVTGKIISPSKYGYYGLEVEE